MLVTLFCAAMTVIFFIVSQVSLHNVVKSVRSGWVILRALFFFAVPKYTSKLPHSSPKVCIFVLSVLRWMTEVNGTGENTGCRWTAPSSLASTACGICTSSPSCSCTPHLTNATEMSSQVVSVSLVTTYFTVFVKNNSTLLIMVKSVTLCFRTSLLAVSLSPTIICSYWSH